MHYIVSYWMPGNGFGKSWALSLEELWALGIFGPASAPAQLNIQQHNE